jgi:hypothetical protein
MNHRVTETQKKLTITNANESVNGVVGRSEFILSLPIKRLAKIQPTNVAGKKYDEV